MNVLFTSIIILIIYDECVISSQYDKKNGIRAVWHVKMVYGAAAAIVEYTYQLEDDQYLNTSSRDIDVFTTD